MTDAQLTILCSAIGSGLVAVGYALRWSIKYLVDAWTRSRAEWIRSRDEGTAAIVAATASNAVLQVRLEALATAVAQLTVKIDDLGEDLRTRRGLTDPRLLPRAG